jgi:hypothetical protein
VFEVDTVAAEFGMSGPFGVFGGHGVFGFFMSAFTAGYHQVGAGVFDRGRFRWKFGYVSVGVLSRRK